MSERESIAAAVFGEPFWSSASKKQRKKAFRTADMLIGSDWLAARDRENRAIGVEAAQDRLVNRDQFSSRALELLDELAAEYRGDSNE